MSIIILFLTLFLAYLNRNNPFLIGFFFLIASITLGGSPYFSKHKFNRYWIVFKSHLLYPNEDIRVSISYLFKIKVLGRYLLVRGERIKTQFQPVGGVFKYKDRAREFLNGLSFKDDNRFSGDTTNKNDLRIVVSGNKVNRLLEWFDKQEDRETSVEREFHEELVESNILNSRTFSHIDFELMGKRYIFEFDKYSQSMQLIICEIHEFLPDENQLKELETLCETAKDHSDKYIFVDEREIKSGGGTSKKAAEFEISRTAELIL